MRRTLGIAVAALIALAAPAPAAAAPAPHPYGKDDGGGFRNILPPGSNGSTNAVEAAAFLGSGARPPHNDDQLRMYGDLVYASPGLAIGDIGKFFKDATFGVAPGDVESTVSPRGDVTIARDKGFGVPHITATTRAGAMFGSGYAAAQDRLFLIDVLRHVGRAQTSSFVGGSPGNRDLDRDQWETAPYTEKDLELQYDRFDDFYGAEGRQIQADIREYVAGVNAYIGETKTNPLKLPAEYAAINRPGGPDPWKPTDIIATASLVGGIFGKGGGNELGSAQILQDAQKRFGKKRGLRVWRDFRSANDPEHDRTVKKRFRYMQPDRGKRARRAGRGNVALPDPGSVEKHQLGPKLPEASAAAATATDPKRFGRNLGTRLRTSDTMSNALLVSARKSASGKPLAVFGPQVSYFSPQLLMEQDVQAPTISARGASFPGTNLYVQLGRGRDYAWSATSSGQDNVDTFAVELCRDDMHYLYRGQCLPMERIERSNSWVPSAADDTPPGSETLTALRTKLGLVTARGRIKGKKVAYVRLRSTYFHEIDSGLGFSDLNDPAKIRNTADFNRAIYKIGYTFHWFYADHRDIAMFDSGNIPLRARGVSRDFPVKGLRKFEWRGYNPDTGLAAYEPARKHPQSRNQDFYVNWNNSGARDARGADEQFEYGPVYRSRFLRDGVRARTRGKRKIDIAGLIDAMEDAGTMDLRGRYLVQWALRVIGKQRDPALRDAIAKLRAWQRSGGNRRDKDRNGTYEHSEAIRIMDAWFPKWVEAQFKPTLGAPMYDRMVDFMDIENTPNDDGARTTSHGTRGWYGYVQKDLRSVLRKRVVKRVRKGKRVVRRVRYRGPRVRGRYSRVYCGGGKRKACRALLVRTLREAIAADPAKLYADPRCKGGPDQVCFDAVYFRPFGVVTQPLIHWINRPTFQQVVEVQRPAPR